jgi:hypothetical protein
LPRATSASTARAYHALSFSGAASGVDTIAALLDSKGYTRAGDTVPSISALRQLRDVKILYLETHAGVWDLSDLELPANASGKFYELMTKTVVAPDARDSLGGMSPEDVADFLAVPQRVGFAMTHGDPHLYLSIYAPFVQTYWSFTDDSFMFADACKSAFAGTADFAGAVFSKNLTVYAGWNGNSCANTADVAGYFFDKVLGANVEAPRASPPQRPFDYRAVQGELAKEHHDTSRCEDPARSVTRLVVQVSPVVGAVPRAPFAALAAAVSGPMRLGLVPSIERVALDERGGKMTVFGIFPADPGEQRRTVKLAGQAVTVQDWQRDQIVTELPPPGGGDVVVEADEHVSNPVQITEWSVTLTHQASGEITGLGQGQGSATFQLRFRADVHDFRHEAGEDPQHLAVVPFEIEDGSSMTWLASGQALGQPFTSAGSTAHVIHLVSPFAAPDGDFLAGDGFVDLDQRQLHLFVFGIGDHGGWGTGTLFTSSQCPYEIDASTVKISFVLGLDDQFAVAAGACPDEFRATGSDGGILSSGTRSWQLTTTSPPDPQAAR